MTNEEIDALTIEQVRRICERANEALSSLRALGLAPMLGGAGVAAGSTPSAHRDAAPPLSPPTRTRTPMSDDEVAQLAAQREALLAQNRAEGLPDEIRRAEGLAT